MKLLKFILILFVTVGIFSCTEESEYDSKEEDPKIDTRQLFNVNGSGWGCNFDISIFVPPCLSATSAPVWNQAIMDAVDNYNNLPNLVVNFSFAASAATADIVLNCYNNSNCDGGFVAESFVNTGNSNTIDFNTSLDLVNCGCGPGLDVCSATHIVMHEMAHALGYFHNNDSHPNAVHIKGTPDNDDPNSIINGGDIIDWCNLPCEFSNYDIVALEAYYGCGIFDPQIIGLDNLCVGQEATYCVTEEMNCDASWSWFGHSDINGSTEECVTLSYDAEGSDFIYVDVEIGECTIYSVVKEINIGPTNILDGLTVEIECLDIIKITGNSDVAYEWGDFNFSYPTSPHIGISGGPNSSIVSIRTPLIAGEEFCFQVQATNDCGTAYLPCEVCYTIPECRSGGDRIENLHVIATPNNACNYDYQCPEGFTCQDGVCCEEEVVQGDMCIPGQPNTCPPGFKCINGDCCNILTGLCL